MVHQGSERVSPGATAGGWRLAFVRGMADPAQAADLLAEARPRLGDQDEGEGSGVRAQRSATERLICKVLGLAPAWIANMASVACGFNCCANSRLVITFVLS